MTRAQDRLRRQLVAAIAGTKPRVPEAGRLVWGWFVALSNARSYHAAGPNPIAFSEIEAFARLHRWPIQPHHVELMRAMDDAWVAKALAKQDTPGKARTSTQPMTAELFDAMFG